MLLLFGKRTARIKRYTDNHQNCRNCGTFDLDIKVYRDYYHLFYIPVFATGEKTAKIECNNCSATNRINSLERHYERISKTPIYFYSIPIIFLALIALMIAINLKNQRLNKTYIQSPKIGDVYTVRSEENNSTTYYFLRVIEIKNDTVIAYHNNLEYHGFVHRLNEDDFFVKDEELYFTKEELRHMFDNNEITTVHRSYSDYEGFKRTR